MTCLLDIKNLNVGFHIADASRGKVGKRHAAKTMTAVYNASLKINAGQTIGLVGESGSGKSVTALSILKLLPYPLAIHQGGQVLFDGEDLLKASENRLRQIRGHDISMIFQEPMTSLNPLHNVEKQISEILELHSHRINNESKGQIDKRQIGNNHNNRRRRVIELLQRVGIDRPEKRLAALPHELSGGQRQRVMIAMAIANNPRLLIADEPTTALDVTVQKQILDLLKEIQRDTGMALLLITHDLGIVRYMADEISVMKEGDIVEHNNCADLFSAPQHEYTKTLLSAHPGPPPEEQITGRPLIKAQHLRVHFPAQKNFLRRTKTYIKAVDDISLMVRPGETLGIVGESGCGKTTLGQALLRLQKSTGEIEFDHQFLHQLKGGKLRPLRKDMQIIFQDPFGSLSPRMCVQDIIAEGLRLHENKLTDMDINMRVSEALSDVGLSPEVAPRYPHEFSGGQRQRIAIARAMILHPRLVVLDEPTSALDRSVQGQIIELLRRLQKQKNLSYIFISHDLRAIRALSHRILVMKAGKCVEEGKCADIFTKPQTHYTRQLMAAAFDI